MFLYVKFPKSKSKNSSFAVLETISAFLGVTIEDTPSVDSITKDIWFTLIGEPIWYKSNLKNSTILELISNITLLGSKPDFIFICAAIPKL